MARIMIVEDSLVMRKNLKRILEDLGHEVVCQVTDGKDALSSYQEHKPDVVTMDITMPEVDGLQALKSILEFDPEAKIIMLSALLNKDVIFSSIKAGALKFVEKPIDSVLLGGAIESVLKAPTK